MSGMQFVRKSVADGERRYHIKPEKREVSDVLLVEGFVIQMRVNKTQSPESSSAKRVGIKFGDKDTVGVAYNNMCYSSAPVDDDTKLFACFRGEIRKIAGKFM